MQATQSALQPLTLADDHLGKAIDSLEEVMDVLAAKAKADRGTGCLLGVLKSARESLASHIAFYKQEEARATQPITKPVVATDKDVVSGSEDGFPFGLSGI